VTSRPGRADAQPPTGHPTACSGAPSTCRANGYHEVWLLDADANKLVSLALLRGTHGRFALPPGVNIATYPVVDVSIEPADGNPAHSGNSVVRGRLAS
jgi:hypothetical protein